MQNSMLYEVSQMFVISGVVQWFFILTIKPLESNMAIRKSIPNETKLRQFSASVSHCQNSDYLKPLSRQR
ncbi:hypothetical protein KLAECK443B_04840 [Klebsiella aerogenes]